MKNESTKRTHKFGFINYILCIFIHAKRRLSKTTRALLAILFFTICLTASSVAQGFTEVFAGSLAGVNFSSVAWGDYDYDGDLDILLTGSDPSYVRVSKIYKNTGGQFTEVFAGSLTGVSFSSVAWGDYDNDGDLDILLTGNGTGGVPISKIYQNTGSGFIEVFAGSLQGVVDGSVAWGDYDNDGDLDILLTGRNASGVLFSKVYQNTGSGFSEVFSGSLTPVSQGSVAWGDYDNDGDLDILLTGLTTNNLNSGVSKIYQNTGSGFTEVFGGNLTGVGYWGSVAWGDYDNDGDLDILLTGLNASYARVSKIYQNTGSGFTEMFAGSLTGVTQSSIAWGDYDNDGDLDILLTGSGGSGRVSKIYQNTGSGFTELFIGSLTDVEQSSVAWGDYDNDGDLDILLTGQAFVGSPIYFLRVSKIYRNDGAVFNSVPTAPTGLSTSVLGNIVILSWNKATDAQTAQNGLTYNLRIGTSPNGVNKLSPMANVSTGYRRVARIGNANLVTSYAVKNLATGRYYWSVQAIDNAFAGSPFASEGTFSTGTHTITSTAGPNGSITPSGNVNVNNGGIQSFAITPNTCYHVADVLVDGISVGAVTSYTFNNVTTNHSIGATFIANTIPPFITAPEAVTLIIGVNKTAVYSGPSATATDVCDPNPVVTSDPVLPHTFSATGVYTITYTATDANGNSSSATQTITVVPTTMLSKSLTIPSLQALLPVSKNIDKKIGEAVEDIQSSLNSELWVDEYHVSLKKGEKVFEKEKEAVDQLLSLFNSEDGEHEGEEHDEYKNNSINAAVKTVLLNVILSLVDVDKSLATLAITEAQANCSSSKCLKKIEEANKKMVDAQKMFNDKKYAQAIDKYKDAWKSVSEINGNSSHNIANLDSKEDGMQPEDLPTDYSLKQNYPNPFNPTTTISYQIPEAGYVSLKVYDMLGKEVATLINEFQQPGYYVESLNGSSLPSGIYFYRIQAGQFQKTRKLVLLK